MRLTWSRMRAISPDANSARSDPVALVTKSTSAPQSWAWATGSVTSAIE